MCISNHWNLVLVSYWQWYHARVFMVYRFEDSVLRATSIYSKPTAVTPVDMSRCRPLQSNLSSSSPTTYTWYFRPNATNSHRMSPSDESPSLHLPQSGLPCILSSLSPVNRGTLVSWTSTYKTDCPLRLFKVFPQCVTPKSMIRKITDLKTNQNQTTHITLYICPHGPTKVYSDFFTLPLYICTYEWPTRPWLECGAFSSFVQVVAKSLFQQNRQ